MSRSARTTATNEFPWEYDGFGAREALELGEARPAGHYCLTASNHFHELAAAPETYPTPASLCQDHHQEPIEDRKYLDDWDCTYSQVALVIAKGATPLIASFLGDHVKFLMALGKAFNADNRSRWHFAQHRKGAGRRRRVDPPTQHARACAAYPSVIEALAAANLEPVRSYCATAAARLRNVAEWLENGLDPIPPTSSRPEPRADTPAKVGDDGLTTTEFLREHANFLAEWAPAFAPINPRETHLVLKRNGAGRRTAPRSKLLTASSRRMELQFATLGAGGKQDAALEELRSRHSPSTYLRAKRQLKTANKENAIHENRFLVTTKVTLSIICLISNKAKRRSK